MTVPAPVGAHRRFNPLTGRWVLVSTGRTARPWQGGVEPDTAGVRNPHDPSCYLCPGNVRAGGEVNPDYEATFVFVNDFPALRPEVRSGHNAGTPLFRSEPESGTCRVVCFSPRHDLTLARMDPDSINAVVDVWAAQTEELGSEYQWVQVFENSGSAMGASSPHPHGQIWAGSALPTEAESENARQEDYHRENGGLLLVDYAEKESELGDRVVASSDSWLAVVPYWAMWPFEVLLLPRLPFRRLPDLGDAARLDLARLLNELTIRYDNLFRYPFPYSMGWHGAPFGIGDIDHWQLHAHFYPPLLRSPSIRKFMVGYELLAEPQRDLSAEEAAALLRSVPSTHYLSKGAVHVD